jgi:hypothetical protein
VARSFQRHPFAGAARIRARELARRPQVVSAFVLQAAIVIALLAAGDGGSQVVRALRAGVMPGGLLFGVLAAAVVGAELGWSTERALLARDPRRPRFVALQLTIVAALGAGWVLVQGGFALAAGTMAGLGRAGTAEPVGPVGPVLAALVAVTVLYGLLGTAFALGLRGALPGAVGVLTFGLLGELAPGPFGTVRAAAGSLAGMEVPPLPAGRAVAVLCAWIAVALGAAFAVYAGREVRD